MDVFSITVPSMQTIPSIRDLIGAWPSRRALSIEIGVPVDRVHKWADANAIPARYHRAVLDAARARQIGVTADDIVRMHDAMPAHHPDAAE
jgi:hypothetical protein